MSEHTKFLLNEDDIPKVWYNVNADMPMDPAETAWNAVLHPITGEPLPLDALADAFTKRFAEIAVSMDRWIEIPEPVREVYKLWRPTPRSPYKP